MREILFRGKRADNGKWVEGYYTKSEKLNTDGYTYFIVEEAVNGGAYFINPETIGQFTGLTDRNSKKLFEGDIVQYYFANKIPAYTGIIEYGEHDPYSNVNERCCVGFYIDWQNDDELLRRDIGFWARKREIEIIGNIYDNPDLVEKESEGCLK